MEAVFEGRLTNFEGAVRCAALLAGTAVEGRMNGRRGGQKRCRHGVDGIEIDCIVVGSLGHFGAATGRGKALRPDLKIFDSVRR